MIQGGYPTGTGKGGQSIWGRPFNDEIRQTLKVHYRKRCETWSWTDDSSMEGGL
jgi:cyclophilin family peptidyl-prolyl cis-trans isomerase